MSEEREYVQRLVDGMKVGQELVIARRLFGQAYRCGWPSIYNTPREAFLSAQIGSAYGTYTCEVEPFTGDVKIGRHKAGEDRVYVDPDRAHWFKPGPNGTLVPRT